MKDDLPQPNGPIIAVMALFYGVVRWNDYFTALIFITSRSKYPLQMILREILVKFQSASFMESETAFVADMLFLLESLRYATIIVASLPLLLLYPFIQRYFIKGIMIGAMKG